jgi:hypothetical protein
MTLARTHGWLDACAKAEILIAGTNDHKPASMKSQREPDRPRSSIHPIAKELSSLLRRFSPANDSVIVAGISKNQSPGFSRSGRVDRAGRSGPPMRQRLSIGMRDPGSAMSIREAAGGTRPPSRSGPRCGWGATSIEVTIHGSKVTSVQKHRAAKVLLGCVGRSDRSAQGCRSCSRCGRHRANIGFPGSLHNI